MIKNQALDLLDVFMNPTSTKEEKQAAYDWLRELFTILLPDE